MELTLLDSNFKKVYVLEDFISLIWTDRYWECGDFEVEVPPTITLLEHIANTKYLSISESSHKMVLEDANVKTEQEEGDKLLISGRSLESLLDRRIVWDLTSLSGNFQSEIERLLNESIISPTEPLREVSNFVFVDSTDPLITALTIDTQVKGPYIYNVITTLCKANGIGFRLLYNSSTSTFDFELYSGVDRTSSQSTNPYVAFKSELDNLIRAEYAETSRLLKTVGLVASAAGVGNERTTTIVYAPGSSTLSGFNRREIYFETDVSRNTPTGELSEVDFLAQLEGRGIEELAKNIYLESFNGEIDTEMYKFGTHFGMGDILEIADDYGHSAQSRITEMIYSQEKGSIKSYPTFEYV